MIDNWNGEVVIMGDFNEVRKQVERNDSIFNVQGFDAFNSFISTAGLEEVSLGDKGEGNSDVLNKRMFVSKSLQELDKLESMEVAQKAKIKWEIEGDENSKYYHDDVVFMDHLSESNIDTIVQVLECFYRASGLRINMNKRILMGISVANVIVDQAAAKIGFGTLEAPFSYLGSKVGGLMSHVQSWNDIVNNLVARLSIPIKVLQRMESIRCYFLNGVDHNGKKLIWVKWSKVLASKKKGGLGVSSFYASNRALCSSGYGASALKDRRYGRGLLMGFMGKMVNLMGNRVDTSFWEDVWRSDDAFKSFYPRIYALETCKNVTIPVKMSHENGVDLVDMRDRWVWSLEGSGEFMVSFVRRLIDEHWLPKKDVERIAKSFFITNFLEHIDAKGLWKVCESYGRIVDSFIANKRSKVRKRFGFVRFMGIQNEEAFAKSLSSIWIGSFHLFASVARFQRQKMVVDKPTKQTIKVAAPVMEKHAGKPKSDFSHTKHSYVSILNGRRGIIEAETTMAMKSISLSDNELVNIVNSMEVALVKVKSVETISTMHRLCKEEGFDNVKIHHVGGLWLWLQFHNVDSCTAFKKNTNLKTLFTTIKPVSRSFYVDERMVWVEISGLPLCAWGSNAFKKVADSVGKFMFFEDDRSTTISMGWVCIATKQLEFISEVVKVATHEEVYDVHIHELGSWSINLDDSSSHNSEAISKVDVKSANKEESECEGEFHELYQEDKVEKVYDDKYEMENNGESNQSNTLQEMNGEEQIEARPDEDIGKDDSDLSRPPGFEQFKNTGARSSESFQSKWGKWTHSDEVFYMVNIYRAQETDAKALLWSRILEFISSHEGHYVIFGDMNEVRGESERYETIFSLAGAQIYNNFIDNAGLLDLPLGGRSFTWMNKEGTKMSKLDQFLVSSSVMDAFPNLRVTALPRGWSDHIPLMLHDEKNDYGPIPFKFFHSWLKKDGLEECVKSAYDECSEGNGRMNFHEKLKEVMLRILEIDENIDKCIASNVEKQDRLVLLKECDDLTNLEDMDMVQKSRIKWDVEGDENSNFFHGMLKQKRNQQMVKDLQERNALEDNVSNEEIKAAVWDCGSQKVPGPDGFTFLFIKSYWELFKPDVEAAVRDFFDHLAMPKGANSSFITLIPKVANLIHIKDFCSISLIGVHYKIIAKILANRLAKVVDKVVSPEQSAFISGRQILNGPFMLSELMAWYKKRNHKLMMFKVDFEKAYDTVSWKFLDHMLSALGFGSNGGGDPLSPFLFIIIMEGLNIALKDAVALGLIHGTKVFNLASGLKINISKSNVYGIGVSSEEIEDMARVTGCASGSLPFIYLGLPIGSNMNLIANWQFMIDRFLKRMSTWKANMLSIGGRFILIKKWRWRLVTFSDSLWARVVKAIHEDDTGMELKGCKVSGKWANIVDSFSMLHSKDIILLHTLRHNVGNGSSIHFWKDNWIAINGFDVPLPVAVCSGIDNSSSKNM
ncbi:putative RNA-directed DNA polymerase, eukaryota, reverse transcriptase zinc-binding domain protein, partial [Tanacetum coccineum]